MNFLELCVAANGILNVANGPILTLPTTVVGQVDRLALLVNCVYRADQEIQLEQPDWNFMVKQGTFLTTATDGEYTVANIVSSIADFEHFVPFTFNDHPHILAYRNSVGISDSQPVLFSQYEFVRGDLDRIAMTDGRPNRFTLLPDGTIKFFPAPDVAYMLRFDYKRSPAELAADIDEPIIPARHHWAIVYKAVELYCAAGGSAEMKSNNEPLLKKHMTALRNSQLPTDRFDQSVFYGGR